MSSKIIVGANLSNVASKTLCYLSGKVKLLHGLEQDRIDRYLKDRWIDKCAEEIHIEIPYGLTIREILRKVDRNPYSLIVTRFRGRRFSSEVFLGSVSHNIVRREPTPMLLVPIH